ncbi:RsmB/NOP family class I SAM-dependent RNA methyltransferase [Shewanella livingstonensis]|uniref:RsmB/NOP family class I SAM-dependent RNA methyltransferase n=1 Tax=Shewanella livingstonensis TaxID=150120 RepID=A0A3G8LSV0_9GAMM|nr:RsmB/NOP family class I SAM-dependent RNA methyltransferase [Shewanella livingstonensis]AZG72686.1 RsmB/NOP family class I SAM-dependent RNA methyltransferase [Shewanella livingstonensis]
MIHNISAMSNATTSDDTHAQEIAATTPAQKRALSYSSTIATLFNQVMSTSMPADRIIGQYFREHKKHGSKDRRVIRESLFGLFRWWGWLNQLESSKQHTTWFQQLSTCAMLEQHEWNDITQAWNDFADWPQARADKTLLENDASLEAKLAGFITLSGIETSQISQLLPQWFWQYCPIDTTEQYALVNAMSTRPPIWARVQTLSTAKVIESLNQAGVEAKASAYFTDAISLGHKSINLNEITAYKLGHIEIQDLASQVIGQICQPKNHEQWWDACSGAGGKTLQLYSLMSQQNSTFTGSITASDIRHKPLEELRKRAKRAGFDNINVAPWKGEILPVNVKAFDGVLVDAPCSCTGTWRRNPDMRWLDDASAITDKPILQLAILRRSAAAVKSGGKLVYATCSLSPSENEQIVKDFLSETSEFELEPVTHPFTGQQCDTLTIWPQQADSDGMFVAKMRRK